MERPPGAPREIVMSKNALRLQRGSLAGEDGRRETVADLAARIARIEGRAVGRLEVSPVALPAENSPPEQLGKSVV